MESGSLAPRIHLRLSVGDPNNPELTREAVFFAWAHQGTEMARPEVAIDRIQAARAKFTFYSRLVDLQ